jgi:tetratricopeptide (TPR) repeat protein
MLFVVKVVTLLCIVKKLIPLILILFFSLQLHAHADDADSIVLKTTLRTNKSTIDSLKQELGAIIDDSLKAPLYTQIAQQYIKLDTISNRKARTAYQNLAISNTLSALHFYSRYNDTTGLRTSFDDLARVYHAQHKYPQAKWFILQSNTLARAKNDNPNIISSLLELASIKTDIKDYKLAMGDLNEALMISSKNHYPKLESQVQLSYALYYDKLKNYAKADIALKRSKAIDDSIRKDEEAKIVAKVSAKDSVLQVKKKLYTINNKKLSRLSSSKKTTLL